MRTVTRLCRAPGTRPVRVRVGDFVDVVVDGLVEEGAVRSLGPASGRLAVEIAAPVGGERSLIVTARLRDVVLVICVPRRLRRRRWAHARPGDNRRLALQRSGGAAC